MPEIQDMLNDLSLPIKSFRIFALENLIKEGVGNNVVEFLEKHLPFEQDEECQILCELAIKAAKERTWPEFNIFSSPEQFLNAYPQMDSKKRLLALANLDSKLSRQLAEHGSEWFFKEENPLVQAALLRTFKNFWPRSSLKPLFKALSMKSLSVRLAAIEIFVLKAPQELQKVLPALLTHDDPRIRALGVRGLACIDEDEAVAHLARMLESRECTTILAGLRCSIFLPFEKLKIHLLRLISDSSDNKTIAWVGEFLRNNPDPEIPYRLTQIELKSNQQKAELIGNLTQNVLTSLEKSNILEERWEAFKSSFSAWRKQLSATFPDKKREDFPKLAKESSLAAKHPNKDEMSSALNRSSLLEPVKTDDKQTDITQIIENSRDFAANIVCEAIDQARKNQLRSLSSSVVKLFNHRDENIVLAAILFMNEICPDELANHLYRLLKSDNAKIQAAAMRVLYRSDSQQALSALGILLKGQAAEKIKNSIDCLKIFEFSQIKHLLFDLVCNTKDTELTILLLKFFEENPSRDNLFDLYRLTRQNELPPNSEIYEIIKSSTNRIREFLIANNLMKPISATELEVEFKSQLQKEREQEKVEKPYSVKKLFPEKNQAQTEISEFFHNFAKNLDLTKLRKFLPYACSIIMLIIGYSLFSEYKTNEPEPSVSARQAAKTRKDSEREKISGMVKSANDASIEIAGDNGRTYVLHAPVGVKIFSITPGTKVRALIKLKSSEGTRIYGEFINLVIEKTG